MDVLSNCIHCWNFIGRSSTGCVGSHYLEIYSSITHKIWEVYNCKRKYKTWITSFIKVALKLRKLFLFLMFMKHSKLVEIIPGFRARFFPWLAAWEISGTWSPLDSVNRVYYIILSLQLHGSQLIFNPIHYFKENMYRLVSSNPNFYLNLNSLLVNKSNQFQNDKVKYFLARIFSCQYWAKSLSWKLKMI